MGMAIRELQHCNNCNGFATVLCQLEKNRSKMKNFRQSIRELQSEGITFAASN